MVLFGYSMDLIIFNLGGIQRQSLKISLMVPRSNNQKVQKHHEYRLLSLAPHMFYFDEKSQHIIPRAGKLVAWMSGASIFSCLSETKIYQICMCACLMSKPIKIIDFSCCIPILIIHIAKLAVSACYA